MKKKEYRVNVFKTGLWTNGFIESLEKQSQVKGLKNGSIEVMNESEREGAKGRC